MKPPLKWVGGKRKLMHQLLQHVPEFDRYVEPFVGGGALFFELEPEWAVIADSNKWLINFYQQLASHPVQLLHWINVFDVQNNREMYNLIRGFYNTHTATASEQAAMFWYLNKTCYSGLYRVNKAGKFNVPFGDRPNPNINDVETLTAAAQVLSQNVFPLQHTATEALEIVGAEDGDFWYLDPPYDGTFNAYGDWKGWEDQVMVRDLFYDLTKAGAKVLLSSSDTPAIRDLYSGMGAFVEVESTYTVRQGSSTKAKELLIKNYI